jgi:hypothetical protein
MSESEKRIEAVGQERYALAGKAFWLTIFIVFGVTIALIVAASIGPDRGSVVTTTPEPQPQAGLPPGVPDEPSLPTEYSIPLGVIGEMIDRAASNAVALTEDYVNIRIAEVYSPVYTAIPSYADFHYSVLGEYAELVQSAFGGKLSPDVDAMIGNSVEEYLLVGFNERQLEALRDIEAHFGDQFATELSNQVQKLMAKESKRLPLEDYAQQTINGTLARVKVSMPLAGVAAGVVAANALKGSITLAATAFLAKATGKMAVKAGTSAVGGAATGAVAGGFLGPVGAVVGGVLGAAAVWVGVDFVAINVDEYFNRDAFEEKLRAVVGEQESALKTRVISQLREKSRSISGQTLSDFRRKTVDE